MANKITRQIDREELYELTTRATGELSLQKVLDRLAEAAVRIIGVKACSMRLLDEQADDLKMRSTFGLSEEYRNKGVVSKEDPVVKAAFAGEAVVVDDMRTDERVIYREAATKEQIVSQLTVAMKFKGEAIGVLRLYSPKPKRFDQDDIALARAIASQCAAAITNARLVAKAIEASRITEQMRLGGIIQRRMIPQRAPLIYGVDIDAIYIPCFDVGGDYYDFLKINDHCFAVAIADVIGKGIPAAIMMSMFRGAIHAYADAQLSLVELIPRLNRLACTQCGDGEFITLFYAIIDTEKMTITYCNCGHEPTILFRGDSLKDLDQGGLILGVDVNAEYTVETLELNDGDCLLFYTDGFIDAADFEGQLWGRERMIQIAKKFIFGPAETMTKSMLAYRRRFVGLANQFDDTSIIVTKIDRRGQPDFLKKIKY